MFAFLRRHRFPLLLSALFVGLEVGVIATLLLCAPPGMSRRGNTIINASDQAVYLSYIEQIRDGSWSLHNLYAPEPQTATQHPLYLLLGLFARATQVSSVFAHEVGRWLSLIVGIFALYAVSKRLTNNERDAKWATIFVTLFGGFGWIYRIWQVISSTPSAYPIPDLSGESFFFPTILYSAHIILTVGLLPLCALFFWDDLHESSPKKWIHALLVGFLLWIHPYLAPIFAFMGFYAILTGRKPMFERLRNALPFVILGTAALLPHAISLISNSSKSYLFLGNYLPLLPVGAWILAFLPWILIIAWRIRTKVPFQKNEHWIVAWLITSIVAILLPAQWDRKLTEAWGPAVIWLSLPVLFSLRDWSLKKGKMVVALGIFVLMLSPILLLQSELAWTAGKAGYGSALYIPNDLLTVCAWIKTDAPRDTTILAEDIWTGVWIPPYTNRHVWEGQYGETPDWHEKRDLTDQIFELAPTSTVAQLIDETGVNVIVTIQPSTLERLHAALDPKVWQIVRTEGDANVWARVVVQ